MARGLLRAYARWRQRRALRRRANALLDALFGSSPEILVQGRLKPHHRNRIHLLEIDEEADGEIRRLLLGIVRHPRAHPLARRGEEVLELLEYLPRERLMRNVGGANLTRSGPRPDSRPEPES